MLSDLLQVNTQLVPNCYQLCENYLFYQMSGNTLCINQYKYNLDDYYRMHERSSPSPSTSQTHSPKESCTCSSCQGKFTGLQLLANVVENIQNKESNMKTEPIAKTSVDHISEPSTSYTKEAKTYSRLPKTMNCEHCGKVFTHR